MVRDADSGGFGDGAPGTTKEKRRAWAAQLLSRAAAGPRGEHLYSNVAYVVAAAMLEERSGTPWETLMTEQVFAPLGMTETAFGAPGHAGETDEPLGHRDNGSRFEAVPPGPDPNLPISLGPAGNVHATFADYARFMMAHIAGARGVPGLVTVPSFETLHTPVAGGYALGWGVASDFPVVGDAALTHDGSNLRWYARVWLSPSRDGGVLIVTNAGSRQAVAAVDALDNVIRQRFAATP
jgi:CubicO group peptidase (beta-lactamase class C family)